MTSQELIESFVNRHTRKRDHICREKMRREIGDICRGYQFERMQQAIFRFDRMPKKSIWTRIKGWFTHV